MNKYTIEVTEINPMSTAPLWDYYNGAVEVICLFYEWNSVNFGKHTSNVIAYYDRQDKVWKDHYSNNEIDYTLVGWLPYYQYVKGE